MTNKIVEIQKMTAVIVFAGDMPTAPDVDAVADVLQRAGFAVERMPEGCRPQLAYPLDDFIEATKMVAVRGDLDAACERLWAAVERLIALDDTAMVMELGPTGDCPPVWATWPGSSAGAKEWMQ
jgi:hypothetical protein